ncbi:GFA family protein [Marivita sp. S6314]|uniref:GFA family protein n=1 Tax=Marivita sp. S6314 TaxID=2926406 RepID=UPI001FF654D0|nr:GFA family protein [Marivita sp. S6314]MCK0150369.1 GFA family protein [Marivita sp. S6314]
MAETISGGCKCGAARYRGTLADVPMFRCYCRDCQQLTGGGHSEMVPLIAETFQVDGPRAEYQMTGGSGRPTWSSFCPTCGSPLTRRSERMAHCVYVHASSLDEPGRYTPSRTLHADAAQPWDTPFSE